MPTAYTHSKFVQVPNGFPNAAEAYRHSQVQHETSQDQALNHRSVLELGSKETVSFLTRLFGSHHAACRAHYSVIRPRLTKKRQALGYFDQKMLERIFKGHGLVVVGGDNGLERWWLSLPENSSY